MKSAVSWSIDGVAPQARETAREAARRAGLSVGEWLNAAIIDSAGETGAPPSRAKDDDQSPARLAAAIGQLSERLEQMIEGQVARAASAPPPPVSPPPAPTPPEEWTLVLDQAIEEISGRQRMLDEAAPAPAPKIGDRTAVALSTGSGTAKPARHSPGIEDRLRRINARIDSLQRPCQFEGSVAGLRRDLADIKHTLSEAMPRRAMELVESQIQMLANRVERGGDSGALAGVERRLAHIGAALNRLAPAENLGGLDEEVTTLSRQIDAVAANGPDPASMKQLEAAIAELRRVSERVASGDALTKLATEVRGLAVKIDRIDSTAPNMAPVSALEQRMESLAGTLAKYSASLSHGGPNVDDLAQGVSERLERMHSMRAEKAALQHLDEQIAKLSEKLEASDGRMAQLGGIERTLADLFLQIEDNRTGAIEAAERAAKAAARELSVTEAGDQVAVEMLKRDLTELRESQLVSDSRNQRTLEALHSAVLRMLECITAQEENDPGEAAAAPAPTGAAPTENRAPPPSRVTPPAPPAPPPVTTRAALPAVTSPQPQPQPRSEQRPAAPPPPPTERKPIDPTLPADTPLEPGSGTPRLRPGATPTERIAASEAALGTAKPKTPDRSEKANFIAAARRAAQAAAADAAATNPETDEAPAARSGGIGQVLGKHKRSLLMAAGVIVIATGALQFATGMVKIPDNILAEVTRFVGVKTADRQTVTAPAPTSDAPNGEPVGNEAPSPIPSAPSTSAANDTGVGSTVSPGLPASLMSVPVAGDVTGSIPKPQNTALLTAPSPAGSMFAPPVMTPADPSKLPTSMSANLRAVVASGDAGAAYEVALRFAEGRGVPANLEEAARWFRRAADRGLAPAQYRLGSLMEKGQGVKKDVEAARRLYTAAAEKGNAKAMHNLAVLYAEGVDGKADYRLASQWFRKAAERGVADSQYNIGILFARGIGVEQNFAESYKWFALAAAQGDQDAGRKRDDVGARLDAQTLAAAKLAAQTFQPEPQPDEAINVKAPPGGWDRATSSIAPARPKATSKKTGSI